MLKLYTNTSFLSETHRREVFPLLFDLVFKNNKPLQLIYKLVDTVETADIIVMPINYASFLKYKNDCDDLLNVAKTHNKPLWIYTAGDYGFTNYIKNAYTFRLSGFDSKLGDNTFIIPSFINDPYLNQLPQGFSTLKKKEKPTIGFVGHAQSGFRKYLKERISHLKFNIKRFLGSIKADSQAFYPSSLKRVKYLSKLELSNALDTQFILRKNYRAGANTKAIKEESTKAFYNNMFNNSYTFSSRGVGNFSVRFYETLAVGRIPILLNTDCRLPLYNIINWKKHCLILDEKSKDTLETQIINFHDSLSNKDFEALQKSNRDLWLNKLEREAYFKVIYKQFKNKIE